MPWWDSLLASLTVPKEGDVVLLDCRWQITQIPTLERLGLLPSTGFQSPKKSTEDLNFAGNPTVWDRDREVCPVSLSEVKEL